MLVFRRYSSQQAETNQFSAPINVVTQDVALYRAYVGRQTISGGAALDVYVDDFNGTATSGTQRSAYDGVGVARVLPVLNIEQNETFIMTNGTLTCAAINNQGTIKASVGALNVTGNVTNSGDVFLSGSAVLVVTGSFVNNGLLDLINWSGPLPPNFINNGVLLDRTSVKMKDLTKNGNTMQVTIPGYTGHSYQLQRALTVSASGSDWQNVGAPANGTGTHGVGVMLQFEDPGSPLPQNAFYRIVVNALP
jgi:hypothetical protein